MGTDTTQPRATDRLWAGGYAEETHPLVARLNASVRFDRRLWHWDIVGSIAHATMLRESGLISDTDYRSIVGGLRAIHADIAAGQFEWSDAREDVHMNVEAALRERIGDAAGRLHTARSRNDQVALDERLWLREALLGVTASALRVLEVLATSALAHADWPMPGYTHLQRAQPVTVGHHLLAHAEAIERDVSRCLATLDRADACPLGAGALAGTTLPIRRERTAELLGFARPTRNSLDAVADRDHLVDAMAAAALGMTHLSRLGEELVLYSSAEFGFVRLPDAFTTGSSLMPQKKNPDVAELVRGKAGRVIGDLVGLLAVLKGLPLAYNKDLQEDKEPLFDALDTWRDALDVMAPVLARMQWQKKALRRALDRGFLLATDLADLVVASGRPFRDAHETIASLVADLTARDKTLNAEGPARLATRLGLDEASIREALDPLRALRKRDVPGAPHPRRVRSEARALRRRSAKIGAELARRRASCAAELLVGGDL